MLFKTIELSKTKQIKIYQDESPINPRKEGDNFGTIVGPKNLRYSIPDKTMEIDVLNILETNGENICLPVFLYDHSGISISTKPFSCPWDSGQVGIIYCSKDQIKKEFGEVTEETIKKAINLLQSEIIAYDRYLRGDIWGFQLIEKKTCPTCQHSEEEIIDSCWGFYGHDFQDNGMLDHLNLDEKETELFIHAIKYGVNHGNA